MKNQIVNGIPHYTPWVFKFIAVLTGRVIEKSVVGFDKYEDAEACARSCVPEVAGPVVLLSYN